MIIGLLGHAGAGKDTAADFLVREFGLVKVALADPLKRICKDAFDFTDEQLWGPSENRNAPDTRFPRREASRADRAIARGMKVPVEYIAHDTFLTPRYALQQLGSEWGRNCYPNVWIDYALRVASRMSAGGHTYTAQRGLSSFTLIDDNEGAFERSKRSVVISDVRFKNEVDAIRTAGGQVWKIERPNAGLTGSAAAHRSETEQDAIPHDHFTFLIKNEWSLQVFYGLVKEAFEKAQK